MNFEELEERIRLINVYEMLDKIFSSQNINKWVVETIQNRIYNTGITGGQEKLRTDKAFGGEDYSKATLDIKSYFNQKIDNVTLKDAGDYYASMRTVLISGGVEFSASFQKEEGHLQENFTQMYATRKEFEQDVMSLTDTELDILLKTKIIPRLNKLLHEAI